MILTLLACGPDNELSKAQPHAVAEPAQIDFDEVIVGSSTTIGVAIKNEGSGYLEIEAVELADGSSADFEIVGSPGTVRAGEEDLLTVSYTPDAEGEDVGVARLYTNEDEAPTLDVPLSGMGTSPRLDLDPETLNFGIVTPGENLTKTVTVSASGSGALHISSIAFSGAEEVAYAMEYDTDVVVFPYELEHGFSFPIDVTFAPPDESEYEGAIWVTSDDPDSPLGIVTLLGNKQDDTTTSDPPEVTVESPDNGAYILDSEAVTMTGTVYDPNEAATQLICGWYSDGLKVADATVSDTGEVVGVGYLEVGEAVDVTLKCVDSEGLSGTDSTIVIVWDSEEPIQYTISGGTSIFDYWYVDDDVTILVNGSPVLSDNNLTKDSHGPVIFDAEKGDSIEVIATDVNYCDMELSPLYLHWGTEHSQQLTTGACDSACTDHGCYSGSYAGPWPSIFFDEFYIIEIP